MILCFLEKNARVDEELSIYLFWNEKPSLWYGNSWPVCNTMAEVLSRWWAAHHFWDLRGEGDSRESEKSLTAGSMSRSSTVISIPMMKKNIRLYNIGVSRLSSNWCCRIQFLFTPLCSGTRVSDQQQWKYIIALFFCAPRTVPLTSHFEEQSFVFPRMFEGYENIVAIQQPARNVILILSLSQRFVV